LSAAESDVTNGKSTILRGFHQPFLMKLGMVYILGVPQIAHRKIGETMAWGTSILGSTLTREKMKNTVMANGFLNLCRDSTFVRFFLGGFQHT